LIRTLKVKSTHPSPLLAIRTAKSALVALGLSLTAAPLQAQIGTYDTATPAYIHFEPAEMSVTEGETNLTLVVWRTGDFRQSTRVDFSTQEDSATEGRDYRGVGGTVVFNPGEGFKTVTVAILPDEEDEENESFRVELRAASPNAICTQSTATITIEKAAVSNLPPLAIRAGGNGTILLSWDAVRECILERAQSAIGGRWEEVSIEAAPIGGRCEVVQPVSGPLYFYRLRAGE
jgi:hypothetical protein